MQHAGGVAVSLCNSCRHVECLAQPAMICADHAPITRADLAALEADVVAIRQATLYEIEAQALANMSAECRDVVEGRECAAESAVKLEARNARLRGAFAAKCEEVRTCHAEIKRLRALS